MKEVRELLHTMSWQVMDVYVICGCFHECLDTFAPLRPVICRGSRRPTP